jgi:hypothetical protein
MSGPRFCPRCGTGRIGEMPFCPACGLDLEHLGTAGPVELSPPAGSTPSPPEPRSPRDEPEPGALAERRPEAVTRPVAATFAADLPRPILLAIAALALVALAWAVTGGRFLGALPGLNPSPSAALTLAPGVTLAPGATLPPGQPPVAPQVGLTIISPTDNAAVATRQVTVIGLAPPGVRVVQDISFGIDRSATADGTGHWAIVADLAEGANKLTFRIGDDRSTQQVVYVSYQPQPTP